MRQWTPAELAAQLQVSPSQLQLLDVRESWEYELAHIEGSQLIPLGRLPQAINQLNPCHDVIVICHHGIRSAQACYILERNGFHTVNLIGGIDRWAREIDHSMPLY
jgi:rhodanese-related sulfurtransferase